MTGQHYSHGECRKSWCSYPLVLLLPEDVDHLTSEVCEAALQVLHAALGFIRVMIHRVFSHLNVQMESLNIHGGNNIRVFFPPFH